MDAKITIIIDNNNKFFAFSSEKNFLMKFLNHSKVCKSQHKSNIINHIKQILNYSIIYGAGPYRISQELKIPIKEAATIIDNYFNTYPKIKEDIDNTINMGLKDDLVRTLNGRIRKTFNLKSSNRNIIEAEKRAIINMPIQGTASELIKIAMINIYKRINSENYKSKMILQIHDELLFECPETEVHKFAEIVQYEMETAISLSVPIKVDWKYGKNWYEAH